MCEIQVGFKFCLTVCEADNQVSRRQRRGMRITFDYVTGREQK